MEYLIGTFAAEPERAASALNLHAEQGWMLHTCLIVPMRPVPGPASVLGDVLGQQQPGAPMPALYCVFVRERREMPPATPDEPVSEPPAASLPVPAEKPPDLVMPGAA
jgi:hypothetical protein